MDWNPYSAPQTSEQEKSKARVRLIIHCVGLMIFAIAVWAWLAAYNREGMPLGGFIFGAVAGLILWLWSPDENYSFAFMFSGALIAGVLGLFWLAPAEGTNQILDDIIENPFLLLMLLFGFTLLAGLATGALIIILWVWNFLAKIVRWMVSG